MKILDITKTANTNLLRSKLRTFLTVLAVFIGTFTLTLTTGLGEGVRDFVNKQISSVSADGIITIISAQGFGDGNPLEIKEYDPDRQEQTVATTVFSDEDVNKIKAVENVKDVLKVYNASPEYITRGDGEKKYSQSIFDQHVDGFETPLAAGTTPKNNEEILLAYSYLDPLGFDSPEDALGKMIKVGIKDIKGEVKEFDFKISGVLINSLSGSFSRITLNKIQELSDYQYKRDTGAFALVAVTDPNLSDDKFEQTKKDIRNKGYAATSVEDQVSTINTIIDTIQAVLNGFAVIVIVAGAIGIINTLLMAVYERTREIGLMKALGMKSSEVFTIFAIEATLIGFWGGIIGIVSGIGIGYLGNYIASQTLLKDLEGFNLMAFPFASILPILVGTMIVGLLAGTLPAIKASRLNPIEALRYE